MNLARRFSIVIIDERDIGHLLLACSRVLIHGVMLLVRTAIRSNQFVNHQITILRRDQVLVHLPLLLLLLSDDIFCLLS